MRATKASSKHEAGIALLTTLLLLLLMSSLLVGFVLLISSGQKLSGINSDSGRAFYAAEAGMEKLTADLGTLFSVNYSPTAAQINAITSAPPVINGIQYVRADGTSGYQITYQTDANGNPLATISTIKSGPYQGMTALATPYTLTVTSHTTSGSEVKLQRTTQTVGIPMFQFGIFSDTDLSFFAGPVFNFGGRTHTNGNLFLAAGSGLTMSDRVTAVKDVIRTNLSNGWLTSSGYTGPVNITTSPGTSSYRALGMNEGSLVGTVGSAVNPNWNSISLGATNYAGNLRNGKTGAKPLNLGIVTLGNGLTRSEDVLRRPVLNENASVTGQRFFAQASVKILLSDDPQDIMQLPCIDTSAQPFNLAHMAVPVAQWSLSPDTNALLLAMNARGTIPVPLAASGATSLTTYSSANGYWQPTNTPTITGYIKIEVQTAYGNPCGTWQDVTTEVLSMGYAGRNLNPLTTPAAPNLPSMPSSVTGSDVAPSACADPHPNAIIRLERVRDNPSGAGGCGVTVVGGNVTAAPVNPSDYWPNVLFDTREGTLRDVSPTGLLGGTISYNTMPTLSGVMDYIELDANNLARWLSGLLPGTGHSSFDPVIAPNDYVVYISDRRGNYTAVTFPTTWPPLSPSQHETGEYGFEDFVNPANSAGCPNGGLDSGEDLDAVGNTTFFTYGQDATHALLGYNATNPWAGGLGTFPQSQLLGASTSNALAPNPSCAVTNPTPIWPMNYVIHANEARENPNFFFRRAVKIINGTNIAGSMNTCPGNVTCGLTIAVENPVYIQGDYNANSGGNGFNDAHTATSILADAVTLLSKNWNDVNSFKFPYTRSSSRRNGLTTYYRVALVAGKGLSFPYPTGYSAPQDFGTDGGIHNFLRFVEDWSGQTLNYRGSIVSMFNNHQAVGLYKCCTTVYSPPSRGYNFDVDFLTPSLLPPRTPLFRDVNTTGFTQLLLPTQ